MKCRGTGVTINQQPEDEVPGTGSDGDDNQETLVIATPTGNTDDVPSSPSINPPPETPVESKETAPEGTPAEVPLEDTPDMPGTPAEILYPVEYPEGHPNAVDTPATVGQPGAAESEEETKEGRDAGPGKKSKSSKGTKPGRNNDADATESKEETKEGRDADLGATEGEDKGAKQSDAKQSDAKTGVGGNQKDKDEKDQGSAEAGESRLANCPVRGNILTIQPKAINDWSSLVMGGNLCESDCDCASGCCGWFWVKMCVNPSMQVCTS